MRDEFKKIFSKLIESNTELSHGYNVQAIPKYENHKIGLTIEGTPIFFIKLIDPDLINEIDYNLDVISIRFNCVCDLRLNNIHQYADTYTIVELKSKNEVISEYFANIILLLVSRIGNNPTSSIFKYEIKILLELFVKLNSPSIKTIQGLWAELFLIVRSVDPNYLINSWHTNSHDTFDFNDGIDKLEVKSTLSSKRVHIVSNNQLYPSSNSKLLFCSIMLQESGLGTTIFDLIKMIESLLNNDFKSINKLHNIVFSTLGNSLEKSSETFFDFNYAKDNLKFFYFEEIPRIDLNYIPKQISDLKFKCDFSDLREMKANTYNSLLIKSIL